MIDYVYIDKSETSLPRGDFMRKLIVFLLFITVMIMSLAPAASARRYPYNWRPLNEVPVGDDDPFSVERANFNFGFTMNEFTIIFLNGTYPLMVFEIAKGKIQRDNGNWNSEVQQNQETAQSATVQQSNIGN